MATALAHFQAAAVSDRGRKRPSNEDAFGYSVEHGVYLVCDGMGGAAAGEIASSLAVDEVMRVLTSRDSKIAVDDLIHQAVAAANEAIFTRSENNPRLNGMGTTMVCVVAHERRVRVVNIGDSRCYRLRDGRLEQISEDHSLVDEQVKLGRMTQAEALRSPLRNVITRAVGTQGKVTPDLFDLEVKAGDIFLLCSDGLTREVTDQQIAELLGAGGDLQQICASLVDAANRNGGCDNITSLVVRAES